jgi:hypothetical protein
MSEEIITIHSGTYTNFNYFSNVGSILLTGTIQFIGNTAIFANGNIYARNAEIYVTPAAPGQNVLLMAANNIISLGNVYANGCSIITQTPIPDSDWINWGTTSEQVPEISRTRVVRVDNPISINVPTIYCQQYLSFGTGVIQDEPDIRRPPWVVFTGPINPDGSSRGGQEVVLTVPFGSISRGLNSSGLFYRNTNGLYTTTIIQYPSDGGSNPTRILVSRVDSAAFWKFIPYETYIAGKLPDAGGTIKFNDINTFLSKATNSTISLNSKSVQQLFANGDSGNTVSTSRIESTIFK